MNTLELTKLMVPRGSWHRALGLIVAAAAALAGCDADSGVSDAEAVAQVAAPLPSPGPALWKVSDADTTVYLFGTFHALKPEIEWFEGPVKAAFEASDEVALEATDTQDVQRMGQLVMQYAIDPQGRALSSVIGAENAAELSGKLETLNVSLQQIEPMEPWMAVMTIAQLQMQAAGFDAAFGVDVLLQQRASENGKTLVGIEGAEAQLKLLDGFPEAQQIQWLELSLRDWDESGETLDELLALWSGGDVEKFAFEMVDSMKEVPDLTDAIMINRNEGFADWIVERMAAPGTVFFAVGAGHLAGPDSVQDFLRADGLTVQRQ